MSVWITSLVQTREVIQMILEKYKIESESERFALFVVKETGGKKTGLDFTF
jgi:Ras association domain-containing protein 2/4